MGKILYLCVSCRQIHYDHDYCEEDGDLEIINKEKVSFKMSTYSDLKQFLLKK